MSRQNRKEFVRQFPRISEAFRTAPPSAAEFNAAKARGLAARLLSVWMLSDDLMTRTASYREERDLFGVYGFAQKRMLLTLELGIVVKKQEKTTNEQAKRAEWKGFVELRLDAAQLEALDNWKPKPAEVWEIVEHIIQDGYRFTLSYNKRTKLATCTLIDDNEDRKTGGYALSSADTDGASALKMAVYKHAALLEYTWVSLLDAPPTIRRG